MISILKNLMNSLPPHTHHVNLCMMSEEMAEKVSDKMAEEILTSFSILNKQFCFDIGNGYRLVVFQAIAGKWLWKRLLCAVKDTNNISCLEATALFFCAIGNFD
eukprot:GHVP01070579.1.p2 GENE.GHVP01070579.1~~GHVP01070579.1.p2  ORF type:complete len:104 (+),score=16.62 GHVP01070579.1:713-1024(+)